MKTAFLDFFFFFAPLCVLCASVVALITSDEATGFRVGIPLSTFLLSLRGKPANTPAA